MASRVAGADTGWHRSRMCAGADVSLGGVGCGAHACREEKSHLHHGQARSHGARCVEAGGEPCGACSGLVCAADAQACVRLGGPPSEFGAMRTPSPINAALSEESALLPVRLEAGQATYTTRVAVDSHSEFQLVLYTPKCDTLETALFFPNGTRVDNLAKYAVRARVHIHSISAEQKQRHARRRTASGPSRRLARWSRPSDGASRSPRAATGV